MKEAVSWKAVNYLYIRLQRLFDEKDIFNARLSGVGGEIGELDELSGEMWDTRRALKEEKEEYKEHNQNKYEEEEMIGSIIGESATTRKTTDSGVDGNVVVGV